MRLTMHFIAFMFLTSALLGTRALGAQTPAPMVMTSPMVMSTSMATGAPAPAQQSDAHLLELEKQASTPYVGTTWSVFNHRGSGVFIFLWALTALIVGLQYPKKTWFRFVPPLMLFGMVEFLILRNDPMTWPLGPIGFWYSMQSPEVFQHRVFILIILGMAITELLRAADRLPPFLARYSLPALALIASFLILFHQHGVAQMPQAMHMSMPGQPTAAGGPESMEASMARIKHEHMLFAILGFGFVTSKLLSDTGRLSGRLGATLWPLFALATAIALLTYTE